VKLSSAAKGLLKGIVVFSVPSMILGAVVVALIEFTPNTEIFNYVIGVAIGAVAAAVKIVLLEKNLDKALEKQAQAAAALMGAGYVLRFLLTGAALFAAVFFFGLFGIIGSFVGTMSIMAATYNISRLEKKNKSTKNPTERSDSIDGF
jgi:hypothetical protein